MARARQGDLDGAIQATQTIIKDSPQFEPAYLFLGSACAMRERATCERGAYTQGLQAIPTSAALHRELGLLELGEENIQPAVAAYERALELAGSDHSDQAEYLADLAYAYVYASRVEEAEPLAQRALQLEPECFDCLMTHAQIKLSQKDYGSAASSYRSAAGVMPDSADARHGLAKALFLQGDLKEAADLYAALMSSAPDDYRLRVQAAQVAMKRRRFRSAVKFLAPVAAANPKEKKLLKLLLEAQTKAGDRTGAAKTKKRLRALKGR